MNDPWKEMVKKVGAAITFASNEAQNALKALPPDHQEHAKLEGFLTAYVSLYIIFEELYVDAFKKSMEQKNDTSQT